jgi:two-component system chemotaxis sensor kinase CheA
MVWLDQVLGLAPDRSTRTWEMQGPSHGFYLAVLDSEGCRYGLVVDDLLAPEEIVVKPLSSVLREIGLFSGATVLGNGALAMILDVAATAARAHVRPVLEQLATRTGEGQTTDLSVQLGAATSDKGPSFLIYEDASDPHTHNRERRALPLEVVERIETVRVGDIERVAGRPLLQYRGALLPLEDAGGMMHQALQGDPESTLTVLICGRSALANAGLGRSHWAGRTNDTAIPEPGQGRGKTSQRRIGLVVECVVDVVTGTFLERSEDVCEERLALVKGRVAVLHGGFDTSDFELSARIDKAPAAAAEWAEVA